MQRRPRFTFPFRDWLPTDRAGGPLDEVLDELRRRQPGLRVERLKSINPGDDDNVYCTPSSAVQCDNESLLGERR